jgi:hypothetical protein
MDGLHLYLGHFPPVDPGAPASFEISSSNQAIATANFLRPLRFNYQFAFAPLPQPVLYIRRAAPIKGCVYSQAIYTGKLAKGL